MKKVNVRKYLASLVSLITVITVLAHTAFAYTGTKSNELENVFTPFTVPANNLVINKTVEHPFGEDYVIPDNIEFDYTVEFGSFYAGFTFETSEGNVVADENGTVSLKVKPGKPATIKNIDEGTLITVKELQKENDGFTPKDGVESKEVTMPTDGGVVVDFINVYTPDVVQSVPVTVTGKKVLSGRD